MKNFLVLFLIFIISCGLANSRYLIIDFDIGEEKETTAGSPMISNEQGMKNDVYGYILEGLKQELVFSGMDKNVAQVTYREYRVTREGTFIKDGFTQNLKYDLDESDEITFQKTKIKVLGANSSRIFFIVEEVGKELESAINIQKAKERQEKRKWSE